MYFEILGEITEIEVIARPWTTSSCLGRYGDGRWRKPKGIARVQSACSMRWAEVHWYEAHGIGRKVGRLRNS